METMDEASIEVLEANETFYRAFNQKNASMMDRTWSQSDNVTCVHPGWNVLKGREAVLDSWNNIIANPTQPRIVTGGATVSFFGTLAIVVCRELVGGSPLVATNVFINEEGAWKLLHHQSSPVYSAGG